MISNNLSSLLKECVAPTGVRPFVCDGNPLKTTVFVVGHNPRNRNVEFWKYWCDVNGFSKKEFERDYILAKQRFRGTRLRLNRLSQGLQKSNIGLLETNLYWEPSKWLSHLTERNLQPFIRLLSLIRPTTIIVHGKEACFNIDSVVQQAGLSPRIFREGHFMNLPYPRIDTLIRSIIEFDNTGCHSEVVASKIL